MCYICGKSNNKIVHTIECRYVKMMPKKNKQYFNSWEDASEAGYVQCRRCSRIYKYLNKEEKQMKEYCRSNGVYYYFNPSDGALDIISMSGKCKIIVNGRKHYIWLYHKNNSGVKYGDFVPGYHSQKIRSNTLMGYMNYIVEHDIYRGENPLYKSQKKGNTVKGSKKWKKEQRHADRMRMLRSIQYVDALLESMASGNLPY